MSTIINLPQSLLPVGQITKTPGVPMMNRLRMLGVPGIIVQGNTVTIGADTYEFRDSSPPTGGTAGRVWVFNGTGGAADGVISRANLIKAINGTVEAASVSRTGVGTAGTNVEKVRAVAGVTLGDIIIYSADAVGGTITASASALATTEGLATVADIWDAVTMYGGIAAAQKQVAMTSVLLAASHIAKATLQVYFPFTVRTAILVNRMRPQNEAVTISGNYVQVVLAGAGSPNNQAADVIDVIAFE
jgi:hypothetical protein